MIFASGASLELESGVILALKEAASVTSECLVSLSDCDAVPGSDGRFAVCTSIPCQN